MKLSSDEEKHPHEDQPVDNAPAIIGNKSPGVARIEALTEHITIWNRVCIFFGVFLIAYAYSLDGILRYAYQPTATSSFNAHSMAGTIKVITSVVAAAGQPTAAKIADVFGRVELVLVSVFFYIIGTIVEATCSDWGGFAAGAVLYQVGYTCVVLLVEVIVADTTSTRSRLFFSYIPASPFIINTWVSGNISQAVLDATTWRWGVGMWCIIYTVCSLPLIISLWWVSRKAKRSGALANYKTPFQLHGGKQLSKALFWQLDVPGIILLVLVFGFILVPLTIAGGESQQWGKGKIIAPLVIGFLLLPVWILWESRAPVPMVPFHLMKDRAVWGAVAIAVTFNFAWTCQGDFLYSVLVVGFNESIKSATRITSLYSFVSVITGLFLGMVVYKARVLKPFIMAGTALFMVAFGLLIHYRGGTGGSSHSGIIGAQILLGIAGGLFPYPVQASIQAATKHEHVAVVTGVYLASYNIGSALGNTVSTAIWTQVLPRELTRGFGGDESKSALWYGSPLLLIATNPPGTPDRDVVIQVYMHIQRLLCITGICVCVPLIFFACVIRNPKLNDQQSLPDAELKHQSVAAPEVHGAERRRSWLTFLKR